MRKDEGARAVLTRIVHLRRDRAVAHHETAQVHGPEMLGVVAGAFLCTADPLPTRPPCNWNLAPIISDLASAPDSVLGGTATSSSPGTTVKLSNPQSLQKFHRSQHCSASPWVQHEEIVIAADQDLGTGLPHQIQKLVVFKVPALQG